MVGAAILIASDVLDLVGGAVEQAHRFCVQLLQLRLLDLVLALHLLDDQLGIEKDLEAVWRPWLDSFEAFDQGVVLGLVVRHGAEPFVPGLEPHTLLVLDQYPGSRRAWIPTCGPVGPQPQGLHAITRIRPQLSQWTTSSPLRSACMPDEVTVTLHARHWLWSTSATCGWARTRRYAFWAAGESCAQIALLSALTVASSVCQASRSRRRSGSSPAWRARASSRCSDASSTDASASSLSSIRRSSASSSSAKLAFMCCTSSLSCISSVGLRMRPLMSSFSRERSRVRCASQSRSDSRSRSWSASRAERACASASSAATTLGFTASSDSVRSMSSRSSRSFSISRW